MIDQKQQKSYCPYAFKGLAIEPDSSIKPCCRYDTSKDLDIPNTDSLNTPVDALDSNLFSDIRSKMERGQNIQGCWKCYKEEERIGKSMRTNALGQFKKYGNKEFDIGLEFLELMVGRQCNLKCRTCGPYLSTSWDEDLKKSVEIKKLFFGSKTFDRFDKMVASQSTNKSILTFTKDECEQLKEIKITGGEPFLQDDLIVFLDNLVNWDFAKNIRIEIFTNCSFFPKEKYRSMLKSFRKVIIRLSLDAIGTKAEYIRKKSDWNKTLKVATFWKEYAKENKHIKIAISHTISILNILHYKEFISWAIDLFGHTFLIDVNPVHSPKYLCPYNFSDKVKQTLHNILDQQQIELEKKYSTLRCEKYVYMYIKKLQNYLKTTNTLASHDALQQFKQVNKSLDDVRNESSWKVVLPELAEILDE